MKNFIAENELGRIQRVNRDLAKPGQEQKQRCETMSFVLNSASHAVNIFQQIKVLWL